MQNEKQPDQLADDLRLAPVIDITRFFNYDDDQPVSIADAAQHDEWWGYSARSLCLIAGSAEAVDKLDCVPHQDPAFDWSDIAAADRAKVRELLELLERPLPAGAGQGDTIWEIPGAPTAGMPWVDDEYRTIIWRVLRSLALDPSRPLDRRNKPERLAAAIAWVALTPSEGIASRGRGRWRVRHLWDWFGVSSCLDIGQALAGSLFRLNVDEDRILDALPVRSGRHAPLVGDVHLLHSTFRKSLIERRERLQQTIDEHRESARAHHPIAGWTGSRIELRARPVTVRWATKGSTTGGRTSISLALGDGLADMEILALTVPDARRLIAALESALDEPTTA